MTFDAELSDLLREELDQRVREVLTEPDRGALRRVAHQLKGSFGLAGDREASEAFARIERRLSADDLRAPDDLRTLMTQLNGELREGRGRPRVHWPEPPFDLVATAISPALRSDYLDRSREALRRIDEALGELSGAALTAELMREVHTLKGSSMTVGDDVMAWFCHGLETWIRSFPSDSGEIQSAFGDHRSVLLTILDSPERALSILRYTNPVPRSYAVPPLTLPLPPPAPSSVRPPPPPLAARKEDDSVVRVPHVTLAGLLDRGSRMEQLKPRLVRGLSEFEDVVSVLRGEAQSIREALRMIGPPRPWGAPESALTKLSRSAEALDDQTRSLESGLRAWGGAAHRVGRESHELGVVLQTLRRAPIQGLFERVEAAIVSEARREEKRVAVRMVGAELTLDRRVLDELVEPLRQIGRNAVVHGIESASARTASGKPAEGTITLRASHQGGALLFTVEDDGRGVPMAALREKLATGGGSQAPEGEAELLRGLLAPGLSLHDSVGFAAGRGVGLDLAHRAALRLGGTIALTSKEGLGFTASIRIPRADSVVTVLSIPVGKRAIAVLLDQVVGAAPLSDHPSALPLSRVLGWPSEPALRYALVLRSTDGRRVGAIQVGGVGRPLEVAPKAIPALIRVAGPFAFAAFVGEELRLCLDADRLLSMPSLFDGADSAFREIPCATESNCLHGDSG